MPPALPLWPPLQLLSGPCFQGPQRPSGPDSAPHCSQTGPPGSRHQTSLGTGLRWAGWERTARPVGSVLRARGGRERSACGWLHAPSSRRNLGEDSRGSEQKSPTQPVLYLDMLEEAESNQQHSQVQLNYLQYTGVDLHRKRVPDQQKQEGPQ